MGAGETEDLGTDLEYLGQPQIDGVDGPLAGEDLGTYLARLDRVVADIDGQPEAVSFSGFAGVLRMAQGQLATPEMADLAGMEIAAAMDQLRQRLPSIPV